MFECCRRNVPSSCVLLPGAALYLCAVATAAAEDREWRIALADGAAIRIVVGMPFHADGSPSEMSEEVRRFIGELARFGRPVETEDERFSSLEAQELLKSERAAGLRGRISKEMIDSAAATLIAERWLAKN